MNQDAVWDYYQNETPEKFDGSVARLSFLAEKAKPGERVLNIGVGDGTFEEIATKTGLDIHSLDPSERSIASLRERFGMGERAKVGYGQNMPFDDESFDVVVISETIEHLSAEVAAQTLDEISRTLVPGGRIAGTVPARENLNEQIVVCPDCGKRFHRWGHVQSFDSESMKALLSRNFWVEEIEERSFVHWPILNWKGKAQAAARLLLHRLGVHGKNENIVFVAKKPCA